MMDVERSGGGTVIEAGVDWITATARAGPKAIEMYRVGDRHLARQECEAQASTNGNRHAYTIWACGEARMGLRDEDVMVELVGEEARQWWPEVAKTADHISRLDLQTTVKFEPPRDDLARVHYQQALAKNDRLERKRWISAVAKERTIQTMYVGSPRSRVRVRIYDKGAEDQRPFYAGSWRYELQLRDEVAAGLAWRLLLDRRNASTVAATVRDYMARHGIEVEYTTDGLPQWVSRKRKETSDERRLRWLREQVRQTVDALVEHGRGVEAWAELGVSWDLAEQNMSRRRASDGQDDVKRLLHADGT